MPSTNQYDPRRAVYVTPRAGSPILYGFKTNCKATTSTACGHTDVDFAALPAALVFGANSPKPGRATKRTATEYESSFYTVANKAALKADKWQLSRSFYRVPTVGERSVTVSVATNGSGTATGAIQYAWQMQRHLYDLIEAELTALGIDLPASGAQDLTFGADLRLPRASKVIVDAGDGSSKTVSTIVAPAKFDSLPAGWTPAGGSRRYDAI